MFICNPDVSLYLCTGLECLVDSHCFGRTAKHLFSEDRNTSSFICIFSPSFSVPISASSYSLYQRSLGIVAAFVWAGGVGRLNKKRTRQIYLPVFAALLALSVACVVNDANSLLSVNANQCPSTGELYSVLSSFQGYNCTCHTGAIFWATLGLDCAISLFSILCGVAL
ncbi:hypothetical protein Gasu2_26090 [Galdieria sulphuraria]|nr:hypothetical protein Gasu2_26090 [Galdieria sulphuraria]